MTGVVAANCDFAPQVATETAPVEFNINDADPGSGDYRLFCERLQQGLQTAERLLEQPDFGLLPEKLLNSAPFREAQAILKKNGYTIVDPLGTLFPMTKKYAAIRIRVEKPLHGEFLAICQAQDKPAASVILAFMRKYVSKY